MSWTYSGDPTKNIKDAVRFLVGDTNSSDALASDEEILWALKLHDNQYHAAALIAQGIAANFARLKISVKIGPISEEYGNRAEFYLNIVKELKIQAMSNISVIPYAGGISANDKLSADPDNATSFSKGMTDYENRSAVVSNE